MLGGDARKPPTLCLFVPYPKTWGKESKKGGRKFSKKWAGEKKQNPCRTYIC